MSSLRTLITVCNERCAPLLEDDGDAEGAAADLLASRSAAFEAERGEVVGSWRLMTISLSETSNSPEMT